VGRSLSLASSHVQPGSTVSGWVKWSVPLTRVDLLPVSFVTIRVIPPTERFDIPPSIHARWWRCPAGQRHRDDAPNGNGRLTELACAPSQAPPVPRPDGRGTGVRGPCRLRNRGLWLRPGGHVRGTHTKTRDPNPRTSKYKTCHGAPATTDSPLEPVHPSPTVNRPGTTGFRVPTDPTTPRQWLLHVMAAAGCPL